MGIQHHAAGGSDRARTAPRHRFVRRHRADGVQRRSGLRSAPEIRRHQRRPLPPAVLAGRRRRHRRRQGHPVGAGVRPARGHRRRDQPEHPRARQRPVRRLHRPSRSRPARAFRQRRSAQLPGTDARPRRPHPDLADRHLGRDRERRVRADGELALHARGLDELPEPADAARRPLGVAVVLRRSSGRGLPKRGAGGDDAAEEGREAPGRSLRHRAGAADADEGRARRHRHDPGVARAVLRRRPRRARRGRRAVAVRSRAEPADLARRDVRRHRRRRAAAGAARELPARHQRPDRRQPVLLPHAAPARRLQPAALAGSGHRLVQHESGRRARRAARDGHADDRRVHPSAARPRRGAPSTFVARRLIWSTSRRSASASCWWRSRSCSG